MSFAQPAWLLLGLLGILILAFHIRRRSSVKVSTVELWRHLASSSKAQKAWRLPNASWPLLLQLLVVALLALGLARPQPSWNAQSPDHWIVIVDTSGSMLTSVEGETRFEQALAWLQRDFLTLKAGTDNPALSLIAVGSEINIMGVRLSHSEEIAQALAKIEPSDGRAPWEDLASLLPGLMASNELLRVTVLTDGAAAAAARTALQPRVGEDKLEVVEFGVGADNAGVGAVKLTSSDLELGRWQVTGEVLGFAEDNGAHPRILSVLFTPEGTTSALPWAEQELNFQDSTATFDFEVELPSAGLLELRLPDDALAADNQTHFVLLASPRRVRVLHLGPDNPPLQRALEAVEGIELFRADALPEGNEAFDLVVVDRIALPRHPGTHTLWVGGASLRGEESPRLQEPTPTGWKTDSPLSASVDWSAVLPGRSYRVPHLPGAAVLLEAAGAPLIQARTTAVGREVVIAFDLLTSSWVEELGFPVFISNLLRWTAPWNGQVVGQRCTVGELCSLEPRTLSEGVTLLPARTENPAIMLPSPFVTSGLQTPTAQAWAPPGFVDLFRPRKAGLYHFENGEEYLAISAPAGAESDVRAAASTSESSVTVSASPLSRWLLFGALLALMLEAWFAGRGRDRYLQPSSSLQGNPQAIRPRWVLGLRAATLLLVIFALLNVPGFLLTRAQRLVLVVDDADLYGPAAQDLMRETLAKTTMRANGQSQTGMVSLGTSGRVLADLIEPLEIPSTEGETLGANLAAALDLSQGLLGESESGRIVVIASGAQTQGEVARVLPKLIARGTPVDVMPLGGVPPGEVFVEHVTPPPQLFQGDTFLLQGVIYSSTEIAATVRVWRQGELKGEQAVHLLPGRNRVETSFSEEAAGQHLYEYEVIADSDVFSINNRDGVVVEALPKAKVAVITAQPQWGGVMADALTLQGLEVEVLSPIQAPYTLDGLLAYDAVILSNVPAIDLHSSQQEILETWVRDYGGGLLVLGGENSFGPGGYYQTPLERVSPLSSRIPREAPKVAMLFVLDRSGSMQQRVDGVSRLDIAKQATVDAAKLLHEESLAGIIVFDSEATNLVPLQPAEGGAAFEAALGPLQPGGGTSIYPALAAAYEEMGSVDAATRHIIVMTDGLSEPGDFGTLSARMARDKITVSTVSVGQGADTRLLQDIARNGGGAFHATSDFRALPSILSQEALMLSSTPVEEGTFVPSWKNRDATFLTGLPSTLPPLYGYVRTSIKPQATVHIGGPEDDPILASWRYGLGRVVAFTSHGAGEWTREWVNTPTYPLLWSQAVRWALPPVVKPGLHLTFERTGDEVTVQVDVVGEEGELREEPRLTASLSGPEKQAALPLRLTPSEPGRYQAKFVAGQPGSYEVKTVVSGEPTSFPPAQSVFHVGYPARYAFEVQDTERLWGLAAATGGRVLLGDEPLNIGARPFHWRQHTAWPLWTVLALIIFMLELALRYMPNTIQRLKAKFMA